jgi:hypothetical protein
MAEVIADGLFKNSICAQGARPDPLRRNAPVMSRQDRDVLRALPQRGETGVNDIEYEQQVRPESRCGRLGAHVAIGGGHEPYIDLAREGFADASDFLLLCDAHRGCRPSVQA